MQPRKTSNAQRQQHWHTCVDRQLSSGQSVAAFCRAEGIAPQTFYGWKARLQASGKKESKPRLNPTSTSEFIDLGAIDAPVAATTGIEIRLDLGEGLVLTIVKR